MKEKLATRQINDVQLVKALLKIAQEIVKRDVSFLTKKGSLRSLFLSSWSTGISNNSFADLLHSSLGLGQDVAL